MLDIKMLMILCLAVSTVIAFANPKPRCIYLEHLKPGIIQIEFIDAYEFFKYIAIFPPYFLCSSDQISIDKGWVPGNTDSLLDGKNKLFSINIIMLFAY